MTYSKQHYGFAEGEAAKKYELFLRDNILSLNPKYYGIVDYQAIRTWDGPMCTLGLTKELCDPNLDVIAEGFINNQYVYLWKDVVWTTAREQNASAARSTIQPFVLPTDIRVELLDTNYTTNLVIVIYPIGDTPEWLEKEAAM